MGAMQEGIRVSAQGTAIDADEFAIRLARAAYSPEAPADRAIAREKLEAAYEAYFGLDLARAQRLLREASGALERTPQTPDDLALLSDLRLLEGIIALGSDPAAAREKFEVVARLTPGRTLDPRRFPPHVANALREAEERLRQTPVAQLNVEGTPGEVWFSLDGVVRGRTPLSLDRIAAGEHYYRLERAGLQPKYGRIELQEGTVEVLRQFLPVVTVAELEAPVEAMLAATDDRGSAGAGLARMLAADRVVLASIAMDGARHYQVEMWWAAPDGTACEPLWRTVPGEPSEFSSRIAAMAREVVARDAVAPVGGLRPNPQEVARDLALVGARRAARELTPPPPAWWRRKDVLIGTGAVLFLGSAGFFLREAAKPGKVDYKVDITREP